MCHFGFHRATAVALLLFASSAFASHAGSKSVDDAWASAMKANRLEDVVKTYAQDAVLWLPGSGEIRGQAAIRAAYEGILAANTVVDVQITDTAYTTSGNLSAGWGKFKLTLQPKAGGDHVVMTGRFTEVTERRGTGWVYVSDHTSAEPAAK
jgi:ketosteroid isomerase-like protein